MRTPFLILTLIGGLGLSGCASFDVGRYGVSVENNAALKKLGGAKVAVGPFTAAEPGKKEISCRAVGPIKTPDEQPFEDWIRKALIDELTVADLLVDSAPVTLTGKVNKIDFDSMAGDWFLDLTVTSSNGRSLSVANTYNYGFTYVGETACARTAKSFAPAVQVLIGKLVYDARFADLLK
ncbi:MAG TPA: hypothetical protein VID28_08010 [Methylomirabilota bacterium]|jgi:hypothetical protein